MSPLLLLVVVLVGGNAPPVTCVKARCDGEGPEKSQQDDSQQLLSPQITVSTVCLTPYSHLPSVGFCFFLFFSFICSSTPPPTHPPTHHPHCSVIKVEVTRYVRPAFVFTWLPRQRPKLPATLNEIPACHQSLGSTKSRLLRFWSGSPEVGAGGGCTWPGLRPRGLVCLGP